MSRFRQRRGALEQYQEKCESVSVRNSAIPKAEPPCLSVRRFSTTGLGHWPGQYRTQATELVAGTEPVRRGPQQKMPLDCAVGRALADRRIGTEWTEIRQGFKSGEGSRPLLTSHRSSATSYGRSIGFSVTSSFFAAFRLTM